MTVAEKIKVYRKKEGLTQEQIANYLGVSTPAVNKWERGNTFPDVTLLPALEGLGVTYFHRNTKMYDTLLQMGRWFGYRPNYGDVAKV